MSTMSQEGSRAGLLFVRLLQIKIGATLSENTPMLVLSILRN